MTKLGPAFPLELTVAAAYRVRMDAKAAASARAPGKPVSWAKIIAENCQDYLLQAGGK